MRRILFIIPPHMPYSEFVDPPTNARSVKKSNGNFGSVLTDMPLGAMTLSAYVKKYAGVSTKLLDFNIALNGVESFEFKSYPEFFRFELLKLKDYNPDIIGISTLFTPAFNSTMEISNCCNKIFPKAILLGGGGVPTNMYREIYEKTGVFHALCYGEGEKPLLDLVKAADLVEHLEKNPAWITKAKVKLGAQFKHDFVKNLDDLPFLDYEMGDIDKYSINPTITSYASLPKGQRNFHVMTSRGCTFKCCFCSSFTVHGRYIRYYSLKRVKADFERLKNEYKAKILIFQDDHLMGDKNRALKIIRMIKELGIAVSFQNALAMYTLDKDVLELLKSAGVTQLTLPVESGSNRVLKEIMHKPLKQSVICRVIKDCRELGIYTNVNILIGLPEETKKDIEDARKFLRTLDANWFHVVCATPLIGSEMYEICKEKNYFKEDFVNSSYKKAVVETEDFTAKYIQDMTYIFNLDLNFVNNADFRLGNYSLALEGFENVIMSKYDHAFAHYYISKCYDRLGLKDKSIKHMAIAKELSLTKYWKRYIEMFKIEELYN